MIDRISERKRCQMALVRVRDQLRFQREKLTKYANGGSRSSASWSTTQFVRADIAAFEFVRVMLEHRIVELSKVRAGWLTKQMRWNDVKVEVEAGGSDSLPT